jgi:two-component system sensor histidine kinase UhpB
MAAPGSGLAELLRLLLLAAVVVFAMRHGWRGAATSVLAASLAIAIEDHLGGSLLSPVWMQLFIAITGAMALLFGAAVDDLRRHGAALAAAQATSARLAGQLFAAATRNLQAEERERRRLAGELHDEFGQTLTAMQTHLKLAQPELMQMARPDIADTLLDLTRTMRQNIVGVLEALRPAALDELGLYGAIDRGGLRHLAEDAGLGFEVRLEGDARLLAMLDDTHRIAAYRAIQTSVTNVVRHAQADTCTVRIRASQRTEMLWLFLDILDDGVGNTAWITPRHGLTGLRDRITALGGHMTLRNRAPGLRVHILLRQAIGEQRHR